MKSLKKAREKSNARRVASKTIFWICMIILIVIMMFVPILGGVIRAICMIAMLISFIIYGIKSVRYRSEVKFNKKTLTPFIKENYPNAEYGADDFFLPKKVNKCNTISDKWIEFPDFPDYNLAKGQDYLSWKTDSGTPFKYCEVNLNYVHSSGKSSSIVEIFSGALLVTMSHKVKNISSNIYVHSSNTNPFVDKYAYVETENPTFNDYFSCHCDKEKDLFYILTPQFMEELIKFNDKVGDFHLWIKPNGELLFAIPKLNLFRKRGEQEARMNAKKDIALLTSMAEAIDWDDDLKIGKQYMHKKEPLKINEHATSAATKELRTLERSDNKIKLAITLGLTTLILGGVAVAALGTNMSQGTNNGIVTEHTTEKEMTDWEKSEFMRLITKKYSVKETEVNLLLNTISKEKHQLSGGMIGAGKKGSKATVTGSATIGTTNPQTFEFQVGYFEYTKNDKETDDSYGILMDNYQTKPITQKLAVDLQPQVPIGYKVSVEAPLMEQTEYVKDFVTLAKRSMEIKIWIINEANPETPLPKEQWEGINQWLKQTSPYNTPGSYYTITYAENQVTSTLNKVDYLRIPEK